MVFDQIYGALLVWLEFMIIIRHEIVDIPRSSRPTEASLKSQNSYRPMTQSIIYFMSSMFINTNWNSKHQLPDQAKRARPLNPGNRNLNHVRPGQV